MVGEHVRRLRHARGLTQQELAHEAGVHYHTLERVERGKPCSPATRAKLAHALGVEPDELGQVEAVA